MKTCCVLHHLLDVLEALHFDGPQARYVQVSRSIRVDLDVQFLSVFAQQVSEMMMN